MKRLLILAFGVTCSLTCPAQTDDFDSFLNSELSSFDKFIDDANKEFISFLRDPWKEFKSEKPVVKRVKPEPVKPIIFDEKKEPKNVKPVELTIEEILNNTSKEGKQRPITTLTGGGEMSYDKTPTTKPANNGTSGKPAVGTCPSANNVPLPNGQKPLADNRKPIADNRKPVTDNRQPATDNRGQVTPKPTCPNATPKPTCPNATPKPTCPNATPKPTCPNATPKPTCPNATPKPTCPNATPKPTCPNATPKPTCPNATPKPTCPNATPKPTCPNAGAGQGGFVKPLTTPETMANKKPVPATKPTPTPAPTPAQPTTKPLSGALYTASEGRVKVAYCGQALYVDNTLSGSCRLTNLNENAIADAYEQMCSKDYKPLVDDCRKAKSDMKLNDWGVFLLVKSISEKMCSDKNSAVVMQQFLLNELGYRSKMARRADRNEMLLFVAADCQIYAHPYFTKDGLNYYNITSSDACQFYMCQKDSPKARQALGMQISQAPVFEGGKTNSIHKNKAGNVVVSVDIPKSLMEFYNSVPQCDFSVYVNAKVNEGVANTVLSTLRPLVEGKSEADAANLLINFVQTGFDYATDDEQFGYEKPFFVEELFYYPKCDCEDRAVLYSFLVRNLLGLDVVLLDYPNHIATAVCFNDNVQGDFVTVGGKKYIICDPTYIGAPIGRAMPQFKTVAAKVLKY